MLRRRAELMARTRAFFQARAVLEVDTPLLGQGLVVEAEIDPVPCFPTNSANRDAEQHLLSSPEGPMKRLLAAGSGPIFQLAHAFRRGETGRRHSTEFTLLEWYRPGFSQRDLMDEVEALVRQLLPDLPPAPFDTISYRQLFLDGCGIDPFKTNLAELAQACDKLSLPLPKDFEHGSLDDALNLILCTTLEPQLGRTRPLFLCDYPPSQAALAQLTRDPVTGEQIAERFELYIDGVELANGYHELADPTEQRRRFDAANRARSASARTPLPIDEALLRALDHGIPEASGVALGFDRLVMLATGAEQIDQVRGLPFA